MAEINYEEVLRKALYRIREICDDEELIGSKVSAIECVLHKLEEQGLLTRSECNG